MPTVAVLILVAFFGAGLWLLKVPVTQARMDRFLTRHSLNPSPANRSRLWAYLATRRRYRVVGVLIAAAIGLYSSTQADRLDFAFAPLLTGWMAGAIAVELLHRDRHAGEPVRVMNWWRYLPAMTAVIAPLWTAAAVRLRSDGTDYEALLGWGAGAQAAVLLLLAMVRHLERSELHSLDAEDPAHPGLARATTLDAVRGLTIGGVALALVCLSQVWLGAVPGPYEDASGFYPIAWMIGTALLLLAMATPRPLTEVALSPIRNWPAAAVMAVSVTAVAMVAALPLAWAVPVRLSQEPPLSAEEAAPSARLRIVPLDQMDAVRAELGLKPDKSLGNLRKSENLPTELIGRVDFARPAPEGTSYHVFAFDRRTKEPVSIYGEGGAGWYGGWGTVLAARYPWLSGVIGRQDNRGGGFFSSGLLAAGVDEESGILAVRGLFAREDYSVDNLQLVVMLVRGRDSYIYWAALVQR